MYLFRREVRPFEVCNLIQILSQTRGGASARTCSRKQRRKRILKFYIRWFSPRAVPL